MLLIQTRISESTWTMPVAALLLVGMLLAFYLVVSNAAQAGEARRQATATHATAVVSCHALPSRDATKSCMKQLDTTPSANVPLRIAAK